MFYAVKFPIHIQKVNLLVRVHGHVNLLICLGPKTLTVGRYCGKSLLISFLI